MSYNRMKWAKMRDMLGKVFTVVHGDTEEDEIRFVCDEGTFVMYHSQDCFSSTTEPR